MHTVLSIFASSLRALKFEASGLYGTLLLFAVAAAFVAVGYTVCPNYCTFMALYQCFQYAFLSANAMSTLRCDCEPL